MLRARVGKQTIRFRWSSPLEIYPATYLWRYYPRPQRHSLLTDSLYRKPYFTTFFWGNDTETGLNGSVVSTFKWDGGSGNTYYGAHPYPYQPAGTKWAQAWEISVQLDDYTMNANGTRADVSFHRWYDQAFVAWREPLTGRKRHRFYWDLPHLDPGHYIDHTAPASWGEKRPPFPVLTFGDAAWNPGGEVMSGVLRGIKVYSTALSRNDVLAENRSALSTEKGRASIWYLNENPAPDDIADHSGNQNHPAWVGGNRPGLWKR